jgi:hypothetical protein
MPANRRASLCASRLRPAGGRRAVASAGGGLQAGEGVPAKLLVVNSKAGWRREEPCDLGKRNAASAELAQAQERQVSGELQLSGMRTPPLSRDDGYHTASSKIWPWRAGVRQTLTGPTRSMARPSPVLRSLAHSAIVRLETEEPSAFAEAQIRASALAGEWGGHPALRWRYHY